MTTETKKRTVVVTGANRGIGLEICRQLARLNYRIILTNRVEAKGLAALESLQAAGLARRFFRDRQLLSW